MRLEEDFIGKVEVPKDAYYGSFTARASSNFKLSKKKTDIELIYAVALIKEAAAYANMEVGRLDKKIGSAMMTSSQEVAEGKHDREFILDAFQAGAGTPLHMNVNEVIANRAEELLGGKLGEYKLVHPNNHVNMSQSSNNVIPSAAKIATLKCSDNTLKEAKMLAESFSKKAEQYGGSAKIGRTHLQEAVPVTYGQVFKAYERAIEKDILEIQRSANGLCELGIGGTATGTGITAHPDFRYKVVDYLKKEGLEVFAAKNTIEMTQNMNDFLSFSASLKRYAVTLSRISNDLRLLASGPKAGIAEIILPEVEPGSSIMPGKVNPSIPEAVNMVCWHVMASDNSVVYAAHSGQLELNFGVPLIAHTLIESEYMLAQCSSMFRRLCVDSIKVDEEKSARNLNRTFGYATALNPYLGYHRVSKLVQEAYGKGIPLKSLILERGILEEKDLEKIISTAKGPSTIDEEIKKKTG